jgi:hypothetical protein
MYRITYRDQKRKRQKKRVENAGKMMENTLHSPFFYAILPMLQKNTYVDAF